jgi:hypothetical protein
VQGNRGGQTFRWLWKILGCVLAPVKTVAEHNYWMCLKKSTYLITVLQGPSTDLLHEFLKGVAYEVTLEDHFRNQCLAAVYRLPKNRGPGCWGLFLTDCDARRQGAGLWTSPSRPQGFPHFLSGLQVACWWPYPARQWLSLWISPGASSSLCSAMVLNLCWNTAHDVVLSNFSGFVAPAPIPLPLLCSAWASTSAVLA